MTEIILQNVPTHKEEIVSIEANISNNGRKENESHRAITLWKWKLKVKHTQLIKCNLTTEANQISPTENGFPFLLFPCWMKSSARPEHGLKEGYTELKHCFSLSSSLCGMLRSFMFLPKKKYYYWYVHNQ